MNFLETIKKRKFTCCCCGDQEVVLLDDIEFDIIALQEELKKASYCVNKLKGHNCTDRKTSPCEVVIGYQRVVVLLGRNDNPQ